MMVSLLLSRYADGARWPTVHEVHRPQAWGSPPGAGLWRKLPYVRPGQHHRPLPQHLGKKMLSLITEKEEDLDLI